MSSSRIYGLRDWEDDNESRENIIDELVSSNVAKGVYYGWDYSTSGCYGAEGDSLELEEEEENREE